MTSGEILGLWLTGTLSVVIGGYLMYVRFRQLALHDPRAPRSRLTLWLQFAAAAPFMGVLSLMAFWTGREAGIW